MKRLTALVLLCLLGAASALEINRGEDGYETPMAALASLRDSCAADTGWHTANLPSTLDFWAPTETDLANLDIWLHGLHVAGDSTWAKTAIDTLRIGRVYR